MNTQKLVLLFIGLYITSTSTINAQNVTDNQVYRVTAFKKGNNAITSVSNYAEVIPPLSIYIPSAFTPNNDGINDTFGVKGEGIANFQIYVYNRWGEVIFESNNPKQQWDGTVKGRKQEQGAYVYKVFASGFDKGKTGLVSLVY